MEPTSLEGWVHLLGDGGLPVVLGWLAWTVAKIFNRWSSHLDRQEKMWDTDTQHQRDVSRHMETTDRYLRRIADASERPPVLQQVPRPPAPVG